MADHVIFNVDLDTGGEGVLSQLLFQNPVGFDPGLYTAILKSGTLYEYIPGVAVPEASTVFSIGLLVLAAGGDFYRRKKLVSKS